jgi:hypothetical protein
LVVSVSKVVLGGGTKPAGVETALLLDEPPQPSEARRIIAAVAVRHKSRGFDFTEGTPE